MEVFKGYFGGKDNCKDKDGFEDVCADKILTEIPKYYDPIERYQRLRHYRLMLFLKNNDLDFLDSIDGPECCHDPLYYILISVKFFDKSMLNHISKREEKLNFIEDLKYTLQCIIVNDRIKSLGYDPEFSYTYKEYKHAFEKFIKEQNYKNRSKYIETAKYFVLFLFCNFCVNVAMQKIDFFNKNF